MTSKDNQSLIPMRALPALGAYKKGDVLVLVGELFNRGYANGLVEEAERIGMTIVRGTVGRRDRDGQLRPLNEEECAQIPQPFINIPLEAGFDLEPLPNGSTLCDQLKDVKLSDWQEAKIKDTDISTARANYEKSFKSRLELYVSELQQHIPKNANIVFAHLMAGGVPRAKIVLPLMNRVFKGLDERHIPSKEFWTSDIGKFCSANFDAVTADTLNHLILATAEIRKNATAAGNFVGYLAYGYHGTEVYFDNKLQWQTYTSYLQGWAKMRLESIAETHRSKGVNATVYNCPEILTNSSGIFVGVELSLYPLLNLMQMKGANHEKTKKATEACRELLNDPNELSKVLEIADEYLSHPILKEFSHLPNWPQHNNGAQMNLMLNCSDKLTSMHKSHKNLMTAVLSEVVFAECGKLMLHELYKSTHSKVWIGHDIVVESHISPWTKS
jgi:hypothetical protein